MRFGKMQTMLRMKESLHQRIKDVAEANGRSMNSEINMRLSRLFVAEDRLESGDPVEVDEMYFDVADEADRYL